MARDVKAMVVEFSRMIDSLDEQVEKERLRLFAHGWERARRSPFLQTAAERRQALCTKLNSLRRELGANK